MYKIKYLFENDKARLIFIFSKNLLTDKKDLVKLIEEYYNKTDFEIYNELKKFNYKAVHGAAKIDSVKRIIKLHEVDTNTYLDVGCHKGEITKSISKYFKIKKENIYGIDIKKYCELPFKFNTFNFSKIPYLDNTFDLVTCFMVLHHCPSHDILLKEIFRVMKTGGILIVREHSCDTKTDEALLDVLHEFYDYILYSGHNSWKTCYNSEKYWTKKITDVGFELFKPIYIKDAVSNPLRNYISIFVKLRP